MKKYVQMYTVIDTIMGCCECVYIHITYWFVALQTFNVSGISVKNPATFNFGQKGWK